MLASFAVIVAGVVLSAAPFQAGPPPSSREEMQERESTCWAGIERDHWHVRFRVITAGMTKEQVAAVVAPHEITGLDGFSTGGTIVMFRRCDGLGLSIVFRSHNGDGLRVSNVTRLTVIPAP